MNKKKLKRREEKEQNNLYKKGKTEKIRAYTVARAHNFYPKILREGSAKLRWAGPRDLIFHSLCSLHFIYFWGSNEKERSCDGQGGGAQRPIWGVNELKKTVRAAHGRARAAKTD